MPDHNCHDGLWWSFAQSRCFDCDIIKIHTYPLCTNAQRYTGIIYVQIFMCFLLDGVSHLSLLVAVFAKLYSV